MPLSILAQDGAVDRESEQSSFELPASIDLTMELMPSPENGNQSRSHGFRFLMSGKFFSVNHHSFGFGTGIQSSEFNRDLWHFPFFLDYEYDMPWINRLDLSAKAGYSLIPKREGWVERQAGGGFFINPNIGFTAFENDHFSLSIRTGILIQELKYKELSTVVNNYEAVYDRVLRRYCFGIAFSF